MAVLLIPLRMQLVAVNLRICLLVTVSQCKGQYEQSHLPHELVACMQKYRVLHLDRPSSPSLQLSMRPPMHTIVLSGHV